MKYCPFSTMISASVFSTLESLFSIVQTKLLPGASGVCDVVTPLASNKYLPSVILNDSISL